MVLTAPNGHAVSHVPGAGMTYTNTHMLDLCMPDSILDHYKNKVFVTLKWDEDEPNKQTTQNILISEDLYDTLFKHNRDLQLDRAPLSDYDRWPEMNPLAIAFLHQHLDDHTEAVLEDIQQYANDQLSEFKDDPDMVDDLTQEQMDRISHLDSIVDAIQTGLDALDDYYTPAKFSRVISGDKGLSVSSSEEDESEDERAEAERASENATEEHADEVYPEQKETVDVPVPATPAKRKLDTNESHESDMSSDDSDHTTPQKKQKVQMFTARDQIKAPR